MHILGNTIILRRLSINTLSISTRVITKKNNIIKI